jgi:hypothetical protein
MAANHSVSGSRMLEASHRPKPLLEVAVISLQTIIQVLRAEDCSFETFLEEHDLEYPVLGEIGEIVHDAELMDEEVRPPRVRGPGRPRVRGMQLSLPDGQTPSGHTDVLYDGLYAYLSREVL